MKIHKFVRETFIPKPVEEIFDFFSKAENLQRITPEFLHFSMLTPQPIKMGKGTSIDYKLKLYGIPFRWRTVITDWEPPYHFSDTQVKGPYVIWVHHHYFESVPGGTKMRDEVEHFAPGGLIEPLINSLFVAANVSRIFDFREKVLKDIFGN